MSKQMEFRRYVADFETTVFKGQDHTEVWAAAITEIGTENCAIFHSIDEFMHYVFQMLEDNNIMIYFHNLKFDGNFILYWLLCSNLSESAEFDSDGNIVKFTRKSKDMRQNTFKYSISDMGQWYNIVIAKNYHILEIRDSLKMLPFSVKEIGKSFKTKHKKLEMEYTGFRYAGCTISNEEQEYIKNDVFVVSEAIEQLLKQGHDSMTIGSCCMKEYKRTVGRGYKDMFPSLEDEKLPKNIYGSENVDEYIRKSYKGGWCYLVEGKENQIFSNGVTADVNSLYPSMMSSESGNRYPIGNPIFWTGAIPNEALRKNRYYFVRFKCRFYIKAGYLPFIQIKGSWFYKSTEMLKTSDVRDKDGNYHKFLLKNGTLIPTAVTLTMTCTDFELFLEHYRVEELEILDGCYFKSALGIFDEYITFYKEQKINSTGAKRTLAKLFLNNLYGKLASNTCSSFKVAYMKEDMTLGFYTQLEYDKKAGYIAAGSAVTSYARNFTIRAAQKNYHGENESGFIYADTDSIHCDIPATQLVGVPIDDKAFCRWKLESTWDKGVFVRQKTYIEHVVTEDEQPCKPYYNIKCAGMPQKCKDLIIKSFQKDETGDLSDEEKDFINKSLTMKDFKVGLSVPGKLLPKRIKGGVLLVDTTYVMK